MSNNVNGRVKWYNEYTGVGIIATDIEDVSVNYTEIRGDGFKTLRPGQKVSFDLVKGPKGNIARNVCIID